MQSKGAQRAPEPRPGTRVSLAEATMSAMHRILASTALLALAAPLVQAQQLEPRAYSNVPVGLNFLIAGYTYSSGGLATDPSLPLDNAELEIHAPFVAYARAFDAWGKSAKFDAVLGAGCLSGTAESNGA